MPAMLDNARQVLRRTFGHDDFRGEQAGAITAALNGRDAVVLMPTGGGKSLCYQVPPLTSGTCTLVVSPLIALMADQVAALDQAGVPAACLNSSLSPQAQAEVFQALRANRLHLLYVAPERVQQPATLARLKEARIGLIAIDEAHCVSQWGHDFRKDYLSLGELREHFPGVPMMALTATADARTRTDIAERLRLQDPGWFIGGFDRPNIRYSVRLRANARQQLAKFLANRRGEAGIVYCMSRKKVEETAAWLRTEGFDALPYHAGLADQVRSDNQSRFLREDGVVICATIAFGMGIDKPDVRFVAHLDLPKSVEAYYQETGRAGRDGAPAEAWMVYGLQDVVRLHQMVDQSDADDAHKRVERQKLDALLAWCEATQCRRAPLLAYFGEPDREPCGNCDNCLEPPVTFDATDDARKLLSCVYRTGQRFGAAHVIDVLRGADTEKVRSNDHHQLSTFGIGADKSTNHWRSVLRQLLVRGAVFADAERYGALRLNETARPILRGEVRLELRELPAERGTAPQRRREAVAVPETDRDLWDRLRACRKRLAEEQGVPPYVIFHDRTLQDMLAIRPRNLDEMLLVDGVGRTKADRYGEAFLAELRLA